MLCPVGELPTVRNRLCQGWNQTTTAQGLLDLFITKEFKRAYLLYLWETFQGLVSVSDVIEVPP
jgi:hypothetical protein